MKSTIAKTLQIFRENFREIPLTPAFSNPFKTLVAVMLSARTRDETTVKIALKLFEVASTPEKISFMPLDELTKKIYGVSFYKTKAKNLQELSRQLILKFNSTVPKTLAELTSLPGIGRKTANIVLGRAFAIPAIGVDTHVHRVANTLTWVNTKKPEQTEIELMKLLPKEVWIDVNNLLVSIGQQYRSKGQLDKFLKDNNIEVRG